MFICIFQRQDPEQVAHLITIVSLYGLLRPSYDFPELTLIAHLQCQAKNDFSFDMSGVKKAWS